MPIIKNVSGGGSGEGAFGAVLEQGDDASKGLFIFGPETDPSWHLRGVERQIEEAAVKASLRYSNAADDAHLDVAFGRDSDQLRRFVDPIAVSYEPEQMNGARVTYRQYPDPSAQKASKEVNDQLTVRAAAAGVAGNDLELLVREGLAAVTAQNSGAVWVRSINPNTNTDNNNGIRLVITGNDAGDYNGAQVSVRATVTGTATATAIADVRGSTAVINTARNIKLDFHEAGTHGNGFEVVFQYSANGNGISGAFGAAASYASATRLNVYCRENIALSDIVSAINAARHNGDQLIVATAVSAGNLVCTWHNVSTPVVTATLADGAGTREANSVTWTDSGATSTLVIASDGTWDNDDVAAAIRATAFPGTAAAQGGRGSWIVTVPQSGLVFGGGRSAVARTPLSVVESTGTVVLNITGVVPGVDTIANLNAIYASASVKSFEIVGTGTDFVILAADAQGNNDELFNGALSGGRAALDREDTQVRYTGSRAFQVRYYGSNSPASHRSTLQELHNAWEDIRQGNGSAAQHVTQPVATLTGVSSEVVDVTSLPSAPTGGANYVPPSPIEFLVRGEDQADGKNIEVRYHADHDTLREIINASLESEQNPGGARVIEVFGTNLATAPEEPPVTKPMYPEGGMGGTFSPTKSNLYNVVKSIFHPATNPGVTADDTNSELDVSGGDGGPSLTDAQIGSKAFENPPSGLSDTAMQDVREAIGAGTSSFEGGFSDLTGVAADSQIPADIARLIAVNEAIAGKWNDRGDYDRTEVYAVYDVVRNTVGGSQATYLAVQPVSANTDVVTGPGYGTGWETYWCRIGFHDGPPNALVGLVVADGILTARRESGMNPVELTLPIGGSFLPIGNLWQPTPQNGTNNAQDTGVPLPSNVARTDIFFIAAKWGNHPPVFRPLVGSSLLDLPTLEAGGDPTDGLVWSSEPDNQTALYANQNAAGNIILGNDAESWVAADFFQLYELRAPTEDTPVGSGFSPKILTDQSYAWDGGSTAFNLLDGTDGTGNFVVPASGYLLISVHNGGFEGNVTWRLASDLRAATAADPLHLSRPGFGALNAADLYTNSDNEVLLKLPAGSAESVRVTIWQVTDDEVEAAGGYLWYRELNPRTTPAFNLAPVANQAVPSTGNGHEITLLTDRSPPLIKGAPLTVNYEGALIYVQGGSGGDSRQTVELSIGYQIFPGETAKQITQWRRGLQIAQGGRGAVSFPGDIYSHTQMLTTGISIPTDAGGNYALTEADLAAGIPIKVLLRARLFDDSDPTTREPGTIESLTWDGAQIVSYQIGVVGAEPPDTPVPSPSIAGFLLTGDKSPAAGSIANKSYAYELVVAQSAHASAVRIVGFAGTDRNPSSVAVLATVDEANFHESSGQVTVPAGVSLAAGESYTIRAEVYGEDQTAGTDFPISYQDQRITARSAATQVRFIRVPSRVSNARPTATNIVGAMTVISTSGAVAGSYVVAGIPNDNADWLVGWIVPSSAAQPTSWSSGGININSAVSSPFTLTENGVDYSVYLFSDAAAADDTYNGTTIEVS